MLQLWFNCGKYKCGQLLKKGECNLHEKVDGFGGLVVSMLASGTQVWGVQTRPKPLDFYGRKNPQHAFLRRGRKIICPMSQLCGM